MKNLEDIVGAFTLPGHNIIWIKGEDTGEDHYDCLSFPEFGSCLTMPKYTQVIPMKITNFTATPKEI